MIYAEYISCNVGDTFAHKVGNKFLEDGVSFSENALELDEQGTDKVSGMEFIKLFLQ